MTDNKTDSWSGFFSKKGKAFDKEWKARTKHVCKPCWELHYCPYGKVVEEFPVPMERSTVEHHIAFLKEQLAKGAYKGEKKKEFQNRIKWLNPKDFPKRLPNEVRDATCGIFGHICPVFYLNEPISENADMRRITRNIPRDVALRVARRDNYNCQICGRNLRDNEIEYHHKIPFSKGGATSEENLEVVCSDCNKTSGASVPEHYIIPTFWLNEE